MARSISALSIGITALATSVLVSAQAQPAQIPLQQLSDKTSLMQNFDSANLGPVLTELGFQWQERQLSDGTRVINAILGGNLGVNFRPAACLGPNNTGCVGLGTIVIFQNTNLIGLEGISDFNNRNAFTTVGVTPNGTYVGRYDIADFGIPRGNVESSVRSFMFTVQDFVLEIQNNRFTVSYEQSGLEKSSDVRTDINLIATTPHVNSVGYHVDPAQEMEQFIELYFDDPNLLKNEISELIQEKAE